MATEPTSVALDSTEVAPNTEPGRGSDGSGSGVSRPPALISKIAAFIDRFRRRSADETPGDLSEGSTDADRPTAAEPFANAVDFNPVPQTDSGDTESSDAIFAEIGRKLRARREMLSLTFEEIERHIKVRAAFLKALEHGEMESLPSPVQTRGILANYAAFIDLDSDTLLLRFADGLQKRHRENRPNWPPRTHAPMAVHNRLPPLRAFIASDLLFGGGAAIMLILFAVWGISRVLAVRASTPSRASAPSISDVLAGTPMPTVPNEVTLIPVENTPLVPPTTIVQEIAATPADPSITVQVKLTASERTYLRVSVDDQPMFEGRTEPGKDYYFQAARQVEVVVGNGAALTASLNGRPLGLMGTFGEVVDQVFTARGVLTPTPTLPPTRTPTLTPTATLKPTPTLATFTPTTRPEDR